MSGWVCYHNCAGQRGRQYITNISRLGERNKGAHTTLRGPDI